MIQHGGDIDKRLTEINACHVAAECGREITGGAAKSAANIQNLRLRIDLRRFREDSFVAANPRTWN